MGDTCDHGGAVGTIEARVTFEYVENLGSGRFVGRRHGAVRLL
jgi:hypothetical protein